MTDHIYRTYPEFAEGELAKLRASVVSASTLASIASSLDLGSALLLGKGEDASGGRRKQSILADALEAVIGAVYMDSGWDDAAALVMRLLGSIIVEDAAGPGEQDFKGRLQELVARYDDRPPRYEVEDEGPDHAKTFHAVVYVGDRPLGTGEGGSKKAAEQAAARLAWDALSREAGLDHDELAAGEVG